MSGIVGILNLNGEPVSRSLLSSLANIQRHRNQDGEGSWIGGDIGLVCQNLWVTPESIGETQPYILAGESVVLFDGRLDNRAELQSLFGDIVTSSSSDAAYVAAAYRVFGEAFTEKLLGDFAIALYDIREHKLLLARDGIGVRPLYYTRAKDCFIFASECKPILAHPAVSAEPNPDTIAAYFLACSGHDRQGLTFFKDIYGVVPGQQITITDSLIVKRAYWDFPEPRPIRLKDSREYAEAFRETFDRAVSRRLRSAFPVTVALSGGLDSSSIFCAGETMRRRDGTQCPEILAVYMDYPGPLADERSFLEEIERQYQVQVHRVPGGSSRLIQGSAEQGLRILEAPYLRSQANFSCPFQRTVKGLGSRSVLTGHWADQLLANPAYLIDLFRSGHFGLVRRHLRQWAAYYPTSKLSFFLRSFLHDLVRYHIPVSWMPAVRAAVRRISGDRSWFTNDLWKRARQMETLQRFRCSASGAHQKSQYERARLMYCVKSLEFTNRISAQFQQEDSFPFIDREMITLLMAVPGDVICRDGVPKALLRDAMTDCLPVSITERTWKAETTESFNNAVYRDFPQYESMCGTDSPAIKLGYLDAPRLVQETKAMWKRLRGDDCGSTRKLTDVIALDLWLRTFFSEVPDKTETMKEHFEYDAESTSAVT